MSADFTAWPQEFRDAYTQAGYWAGRPLTHLLSKRTDSLALIDGDRRYTYAALDAARLAVAHDLALRGLRAGDHALVQLPNGADFYITFWALLTLGVKPVCALFSHNMHELQSFYDQLQPKALFLARHHPLKADVVLFEADIRAAAARPAPDDWQPPELRSSDVAFFQLSGGSTNVPKLIPRTHDDYDCSIRISADICALDERSVYLCALPAPHNFPMSSPGALGIWHAGGTVVTARDPSPGICFPLIAQHGVTITSLVPPMVALWVAAAAGREAELASLALLQVGGAKLAETLARRVEPALGCRLQQVFGMAEGLVCYTRLDDDDEHRFTTQGRPMCPADELKVDAQGRLKTRGPYTIRGYFRSPEHNARVFDADGFYETGDLVSLTPDGYVVVQGREKDQINRGGEKIAAEEVENLLLRHPDIQQVALVAMVDATLGERSCAFLVCNGAMPKPHLLRQHLRACGVADYKLPDKFVALPCMPLTAVGKPDKQRLRQETARHDDP